MKQATSSWKSLQAAKYIFDLPPTLSLANGQEFVLEKILRLVPKRRLIAFGTFQGKPVFAKLFFHPSHADRHMQRDLAGILALQKSDIRTPIIYYQGENADRSISVLLFERIFNAKTLEEIWSSKTEIVDLLPLLQAMIAELANQHVHGILQQDMHLKNFLVNSKTIYTLDGARIAFFDEALSRDVSLNNLALFLTELGRDIEQYQHVLLQYYARERNWTIDQEDKSHLGFLIRQWRCHHRERLERKIFTESSNFSHLKTWRMFAMFDRSYANEEFIQFLMQPEEIFKSKQSVVLRAQDGVTLGKINLAGQIFLIKRYVRRGFWQSLFSGFKPSRAAKDWLDAHRLHLMDIKNEKPIAFIEERCLFLRSVSYFIIRGE